MSHTKEPWEVTEAPHQIVGSNGVTVAKLTSLDAENASRIVACVNACAGMPIDDLEELVKVGEAAPVMNLTVYADDMRKQRDELLDALVLILPMARGYASANRVGNNDQHINQAIETVAKAEAKP